MPVREDPHSCRKCKSFTIPELVSHSPATCHGVVNKPVTGEPDPKHVSTSYVEGQKLSMRMHMRRFTRLTNAFSKKLMNHVYHVALYFVYYNFCRMHTTLRMSPALAAGVASDLRDMKWIVGLIDERAPKPGPRGPYKKAQK